MFSIDWFFQQNVMQFATDLLGCARTADEVDIILKQTTGFAHSSKFIYPRLLFALHNKQRSFVAHPNIQQVTITSMWYLIFFNCCI